MLSVPGAPVIAFLAIDSRIVVSSIEETFGDGTEKHRVSLVVAALADATFRAAASGSGSDAHHSESVS